MMVLDPRIYRVLVKQAKERHVTVQELIRVVIIPEHLGLDKTVTVFEKGKALKVPAEHEEWDKP
jgi:triosephosphate isomerase